MSFIKNGDGKILSVMKTEELTDEQKKSVKKAKSKREELILEVDKQPEIK